MFLRTGLVRYGTRPHTGRVRYGARPVWDTSHTKSTPKYCVAHVLVRVASGTRRVPHGTPPPRRMPTVASKLRWSSRSHSNLRCGGYPQLAFYAVTDPSPKVLTGHLTKVLVAQNAARWGSPWFVSSCGVGLAGGPR